MVEQNGARDEKGMPYDVLSIESFLQLIQGIKTAIGGGSVQIGKHTIKDLQIAPARKHIVVKGKRRGK